MCYALLVEPECCGESDTAPAGAAVSSGPLGMREPPHQPKHKKKPTVREPVPWPACRACTSSQQLHRAAGGQSRWRRLCWSLVLLPSHREARLSAHRLEPRVAIRMGGCPWVLPDPASGWRWWQGGQKLSTFSLQVQGLHARGGASEHVCPSLGGAQVTGCLQELQVPLTESAGARGMYFKAEVGEIPWWLSG